MIEKRFKKILLLLNIVLIVGMFTYAFMFLLINKNLNPTDISENLDLVKQRLFWRKIIESVCGFFGAIYLLGHILILWFVTKRNNKITFQKTIKYFLFQMAIMLICVIPFAFFDRVYWGDYLFPVWNIAVYLLFIFIIYNIIIFYRKKFNRNRGIEC